MNSKILSLIAFFTLVRLILAYVLPFGNDEVYYTTYVMYPDWNHFDHPGMTGWISWLTTLGGYLHHEFFYRLPGVIGGAINSVLIFQLAKKFSNNKHVLFTSVLLYNLSIYSSIISGVFFMPDSSVLTFWLAGIYYLEKWVFSSPQESKWRNILLSGFFIWLAINTKIHALYLPFGVFLFLFFNNKKWFSTVKIYAFLGLIATSIIPMTIWNFQHDFATLNFHSDRVSLFSFNFNFNYLLQEVLGEFLYNNPIIFVVTVLSIFVLIKRKNEILPKRKESFFLWMSLPLLFTVLYMAMFRKTLPHWTGVSYVILVIPTAIYLEKLKHSLNIKWFASILYFLVVVGGFFVINGGVMDGFKSQENVSEHQLGKDDFTLDMYGWKQIGSEFQDRLPIYIKEYHLDRNIPLVSWKWFPASHIQFYIAAETKQDLYVLGRKQEIHNYFWMNQKLPELQNNSNALLIVNGRNWSKPKQLLGDFYTSYLEIDKIPIYRSGIIVEYFFVYLAHNYQKAELIEGHH